MKLRSIAFILVVIVICGCSQSKPEDPRFKPVLNPSPKYFVTYKGFIDPSLNHLVKLRFVMEYYSTNPKCEKVANRLEGISVPRVKLKYIQVKPSKSGHYQYKVAIDNYKPGFCGWYAVNVNFSDSGTDPYNDYNRSGLAVFTNNKNKGLKNTTQKLNELCDSNTCNILSTNIRLGNSYQLYTNSNHTFEMNYYWSKVNEVH